MSSSLLIVGVDPGLKGAIAHLDPQTLNLSVYDMPLGLSSTGKGEINMRALAQLLLPGPQYTRCIAVLEKVSSRPNDGTVQAFTFGQGYGALRMAIVGHGYEDRYVTPPVWKKYFRLSSDKGVSRTYAATRFPKFADLFARVKDDGRAEAALIALYGAEVFAP